MVSADPTPLHAPGSEPVTDTNFAARLVAARKSQSLTQQQLADRSGAHVTQIRRYEAGTSQPTLDVLRALALALNVSADSLLFDDDERDPRARPCDSSSKPSTSSPPTNKNTSPPSSKAHSCATTPAKPSAAKPAESLLGAESRP